MNISLGMGREADILVVDDVSVNILVLSGILQKLGFKVRSALNGKSAIEAASSQPPDLILLDITMPEMDGYEVCKRLKADHILKDIPVIFISALTETLDKVKAFSVGGVDYITKPFHGEEVQARVLSHLRIRSLQIELERYSLLLEDLVQDQVKEISDSQMATILALAKLAESRDNDTGKHIERVQIYCKLLAAKLSTQDKFKLLITPSFIENIFHASPLHDIGKVGIKDEILLKPGKLTKEEFEIMKQHTIIGAQTLQDILERYPKNAFISTGIAIARSHHEKWDGSGYPDGLKGEDIPLSARILTLADVYDALRSKRPYKPVFSHIDTCKIIFEGDGTQFDPVVLAAFRELSEEFNKIGESPEFRQ